MLKLISINIEMDMHHDTVIPFLQKEKADVVCMQELFESDISMYEEALGMKSIFEPMARTASFKFGGPEDKVYGIAIFTKHEALSGYEDVIGDRTEIPVLNKPNDRMVERDSSRRMLLWVDVSTPGGQCYRIVNTHFTWTPPPGVSTEYQKEDARKAVSILEEKMGEFIITGDFNAPRGRETFAIFAEKFKDNIPLSYESSLDTKFHRSPEIRSGERKNMVDCLFSTPSYFITDVKLIEGVSDHKAIVAFLEKV